jgi:XrtN system VIT domain protein
METILENQWTAKPAAEEHHFAKPGATTIIGYVLLAFSTSAYVIEVYNVTASQNLTVFLIHFAIAIAFGIVLIANTAWTFRQSMQKQNVHNTVVLLNLFLISAYALNREVGVFAESVPWFCVYLVLASAALLSYRYLEFLPKAVRNIHHVILGSGLMLYLYMTIYVANFYILGTIGIILLGIGAHIFIPALLLYTSVRLVINTHKEKRIGIGWVFLGIALTIIFIIGFVGEWQLRVKDIDRLANQSVIYSDNQLPAWVKVARSVKDDWLTEVILKSDLVYTIYNNRFESRFSSLNSDWNESRKHDPLVYISSGFATTTLSHDDRRTILMSLGDSRHKTEERLWSGDNLTTSYIVTDVDIYPELRLAYSEQYMNVRNNALQEDSWWGDTEEAIYTFQLPEGSVVTSLSLWIDGKEEKGILTSKQKATNAYQTIVGKERRDPSVVHWQEGNTISVRVFPCTTEEERKFKIGVTTPLPVIDGKVVYKNITFRGPGASDATQTSRVRIIGEPTDIELPGTYRKNLKGEYIREGDYDPDLRIMMSAPLKQGQFSFDGFTYSISEHHPLLSRVSFSNIYLDLNNSWTRDEIGSFKHLLNSNRVYVHNGDEYILLSKDNWDDVTAELSKGNFSLFPFHEIQNTNNSLVVTKGKELSPQLADLEESKFADDIARYFSSGRKIYVFGLEEGTSTYVRSLKEMRAFNFAQGDIGQLTDLLNNNTFPLTEESDERIVIHESGIAIEKKPTTSPIENSAPDHLARLFAYNDIMRQVGPDFFKHDFVNEKLVDEAATAYVVSPVSSLIVLETKEDYERFAIADKASSLHNAAKDSSGAVPEPHEWLLIIIFVAFVSFQVFRYSKTRLSFIGK